MATKKTQNPKAPTPALVAANRPTATFNRVPAFFQKTGIVSALVFLFGLLLYAGTLTHGFTLDDEVVIKSNRFVQAGFGGIADILSHDAFSGYFQAESGQPVVAGGRYRPLSLVVFAVVHQFFGPNPMAFHALAILLFALAGLVLYRTFWVLLRPKFSPGHAALLAFFTAMLFVAHPVHTEAVANVKGCDEILALLFGLGSLHFLLRGFDEGKKTWLWASAALFFLGCLSKENAAVFVVLAPLALYFFRLPEGQTFGQNSDKIYRAALPLGIAVAVFFVLRSLVLGGGSAGAGEAAGGFNLMNDPFLKISGGKWVAFNAGERLGTVFFTLFKYLGLMVWPHPLTHDYFPRHIEIMNFTSPGALLGLVFYAGLLVFAFRGTGKRSPLAFATWFWLLALLPVSNLFFTVGTNMNERFAFLPSVGFCFAAAFLILKLTRNEADFSGLKMPIGVLAVAAVLFSAKTLLRNPAWASNEKLFFTDIAVSKNSAKCQYSCGSTRYNQSLSEGDPAAKTGLLRRAVAHLNRAIEIHPNFVDAILYRANCQEALHNYDDAIKNLAAITRISPKYPVAEKLARNLKAEARRYLEQQNDAASAITLLTEAWRQTAGDVEIARLMAQAYQKQDNAAEAEIWLKKIPGDLPTQNPGK